MKIFEAASDQLIVILPPFGVTGRPVAVSIKAINLLVPGRGSRALPGRDTQPGEAQSEYGARGYPDVVPFHSPNT